MTLHERMVEHHTPARLFFTYTSSSVWILLLLPCALHRDHRIPLCSDGVQTRSWALTALHSLMVSCRRMRMTPTVMREVRLVMMITQLMGQASRYHTRGAPIVLCLMFSTPRLCSDA